MDSDYDFDEEVEQEFDIKEVEGKKQRSKKDDKDKKRLSTVNPNRLRNLPQYKKMSDEDFEQVYLKMRTNAAPIQDFERRIELKLNEFEQDYDLDEMLINDKLLLRALAQALIELEDLEVMSYRLRMEAEGDAGLTGDITLKMDKLSQNKNKLRQDISRIQDDLKITRKVRNSDKDESAKSFLEDLKRKAKKFYDEKMFYIYCPECNSLIGTIWLQSWESKQNVINLFCSKCGYAMRNINLSRYREKRMSSTNDAIMPESMR
jgi:RNase P subunit RPR2